VVATLAEAKFPLSEPVLRQMSGLSGAEFVLLDQHNALQASTFRLNAEDLELLRQIRNEEPAGELMTRPATSWEGGFT